MEKCIVGIDISNKTLDICLIQNKQVEYFKIDNTKKSIKNFFDNYKSQIEIVSMENTGRYNWELYEVLPDYTFEVYVLNPLHLSKNLGLVRGKDDKTDAYRIALFAYKNLEELTLWRPTDKHIQKLKVLLTERTARIKSKRRLQKQKYDYNKMKSMGIDQKLLELNLEQVELLDKQIQEIEKMIQILIKNNETLLKQQKLMLSVPGVGKVCSWMFLAKTEAFNKITQARKMACYSGVVPFEHQSGTSIYKKPKLSVFADKQMKSILHLAAMSAIRLKNDLQHYYIRKVKEGKNKMATLNAVRNKIIHLVFAIIKSEDFYQNRLATS